VRVVHETLKVANANKKNIAARGSTKIAMIFEICMHCPEHEQMTTCRKKRAIAAVQSCTYKNVPNVPHGSTRLRVWLCLRLSFTLI
jgi:hypothetical protein